MTIVMRACCLGLVLASGAIVASAQDDTKQYRQLQERIVSLGHVANLGSAEKLARLAELSGIGSEIHSKWRNGDPSKYGFLVLDLAGALSSESFGTDEQFGLAQFHCMKALELADKMPLDLEAALLRYVQQPLDEKGKKVSDEASRSLRNKQVKFWLHEVQRISKTIDPRWDPNDLPQISVTPPPATGLPAGVPPSAIEDKDLRAQYMDAIDANNKKARYYREQSTARKLEKTWKPEAQRFIIRAYMSGPDGFDELEKLLADSGADAKWRSRILDAVKAKEMPKDLLPPNTTKPAT